MNRKAWLIHVTLPTAILISGTGHTVHYALGSINRTKETSRSMTAPSKYLQTTEKLRNCLQDFKTSQSCLGTVFHLRRAHVSTMMGQGLYSFPFTCSSCRFSWQSWGRLSEEGSERDRRWASVAAGSSHLHICGTVLASAGCCTALWPFLHWLHRGVHKKPEEEIKMKSTFASVWKHIKYLRSSNLKKQGHLNNL